MTALPTAPAPVLIVDDEPQVAGLLDFVLRAEGYRTAIAHDGLEALDQIERARPALVLLDVMMPRMDGWSVLVALHSLPVGERPPVVVITALASEEDRVRATELGATAFVPKPFDVEEILSTLRGMLVPA